jgi:hypothetical protein
MSKCRLVFSDAAIAGILEQADWYTTQSVSRLAFFLKINARDMMTA